MKQLLYSLICIVILTMLGCGPDEVELMKKKSEEISSKIPGTWQITYLSVKIDSYQSTTKDSLFEAREETWENQFQVKPFRIYFDKENKYHQTFRGRDNSLISEYFGIWKLKGDTLTLTQADQTLEYKIDLQKGQIMMTSLMDWDVDQIEDDTYYCKQRLISKRSVE